MHRLSRPAEEFGGKLIKDKEQPEVKQKPTHPSIDVLTSAQLALLLAMFPQE